MSARSLAVAVRLEPDVDPEGSVSLDDAGPMRRIASGDLSALGILYDRYHQDVRRFVSRVTRGDADVEDMYAIWNDIEPDPEVLAMMKELRAKGVDVGWNHKRGDGPLSIDAVAFRTPQGMLVCDFGGDGFDCGAFRSPKDLTLGAVADLLLDVGLGTLGLQLREVFLELGHPGVHVVVATLLELLALDLDLGLQRLLVAVPAVDVDRRTQSTPAAAAASSASSGIVCQK